jgi:hypothetical protein
VCFYRAPSDATAPAILFRYVRMDGGVSRDEELASEGAADALLTRRLLV